MLLAALLLHVSILLRSQWPTREKEGSWAHATPAQQRSAVNAGLSLTTVCQRLAPLTLTHNEKALHHRLPGLQEPSPTSGFPVHFSMARHPWWSIYWGKKQDQRWWVPRLVKLNSRTPWWFCIMLKNHRVVFLRRHPPWGFGIFG